MPAYRCHNAKCSERDHGKLGFDFEVAAGAPVVCPKCGAGKTPRTQALLTKVAVVHYDPPSTFGGVGMGFCACNPEKTLPGPKASGVPSAVTCKACRATEIFQNANAETKPWDEGDYEVEINLKKQVITRKG